MAYESWTDFVNVLHAAVLSYIETLDASKMSQGILGTKALQREAAAGRVELKAGFINHCQRIAGMDVAAYPYNPLRHYVYKTKACRDLLSIVDRVLWEYATENEHGFELCGDEVAQTKEELLEDFATFVAYYQE